MSAYKLQCRDGIDYVVVQRDRWHHENVIISENLSGNRGTVFFIFFFPLSLEFVLCDVSSSRALQAHAKKAPSSGIVERDKSGVSTRSIIAAQ